MRFRKIRAQHYSVKNKLYLSSFTNQGSPSFSFTNSGYLTEQQLLHAYGEVFTSAQNPASWRSPYSFTGKEFDAESGLHYFGARYYLSSLGVWLSTDPLADKYPHVTPYSYCLSNPVNFRDPFGLEPWPIWQRIRDWFNGHSQNDPNRITVQEAQENCAKPGQYFVDNSGRRFNRTSENYWMIDFGRQNVFQKFWLNLQTKAEFAVDFGGAGFDFINIYLEMREANWRNSDKYFHMKANFLGTLRGPGGRYFSEHFSNLREIWDQNIKGYPRWDSIEDQKANLSGREYGDKFLYFMPLPEMYRPQGLPSKY